MGNPISKLQSEKSEKVSVSVENKEVDESVNLDPRSPTADISRTPVQLRSPKKLSHQTITKQQNLNESLSTPTKTKGMLNNLLRGRLAANFDLRSPSANVDRTPLVLDKNIDANSKIILEDVTDSFTSMTIQPKILLEDDSGLDCPLINKTNNDDCEKLDEVAEDAEDYMNTDKENVSHEDKKQIVTSCTFDKRKSYLETNVDCLETDLDKVKTIPKLRKANLNSPSIVSESLKESFDPRSPSGDFCRTPVIKSDRQEIGYSTPICDNKLIIVNELNDPRSVSKEIVRTPIVFPINQNDSLLKTPIIPEDLNKSPGDENILNLSVEIPIENKIALKASKLDEIRQDFAKKYGKNIKSDPVNQIYEDAEFHKVTPRKALSATSRTPLSCIRNKPGHPRSKSENGYNKKVDAELTTINDLKPVRTPLSCARNVNTQVKSENTVRSKKMETLTTVNDLSHAAFPTQSSLRGMSKIPTLKQKTVNTLTTEVGASQISKPDTWDKESSVVI